MPTTDRSKKRLTFSLFQFQNAAAHCHDSFRGMLSMLLPSPLETLSTPL